MNFIKKNKIVLVELLLLALTSFLLYRVDYSLDKDSNYYYRDNDIYYEYQAAKQLQKGENPYDRILEGNMIENDKYATQLPLYFYTLAFIRQHSDNEFSDFIDNYRIVIFVSHIVGGVLIYGLFRKIDQRFFGFTAALLYMFNVWSLNSFLNLKQDMPAIALLILSFYFLRNNKYRWLAYVLFGLSLGIKHIGIFVAPLYITPLLFKQDSAKKFIIHMTLLALSLFIPSAPLFFNNPNSFVSSMLFSITRSPLDTEITYGYNDLLVTYDPSYNTGTLFQQILPRLPLFVASLLVFLLLLFRKIKTSAYLFLALLVFAIFNPIIYPQYITWVTPMALIGMLDYMDKKKYSADACD